MSRARWPLPASTNPPEGPGRDIRRRRSLSTADPDQVNLAAFLSDGQQVYPLAPAQAASACLRGERGPAKAQRRDRTRPGHPVSLNRATAEELACCPVSAPCWLSVSCRTDENGLFQPAVNSTGSRIGPSSVEALLPYIACRMAPPPRRRSFPHDLIRAPARPLVALAVGCWPWHRGGHARGVSVWCWLPVGAAGAPWPSVAGRDRANSGAGCVLALGAGLHVCASGPPR